MGRVVNTGYNSIEVDICKDCLRKKGFIVEPKSEENQQANERNTVTLKNKLYDILDDMGVVFKE